MTPAVHIWSMLHVAQCADQEFTRRPLHQDGYHPDTLKACFKVSLGCKVKPCLNNNNNNRALSSLLSIVSVTGSPHTGSSCLSPSPSHIPHPAKAVIQSHVSHSHL